MSTTRRLLDAWETLLTASPAQRAVELAALGQPPSTTVGTWPVGKRDGALMDLRAALFGRVLEAISTCPECGERIELDLDVDVLRRSIGTGTTHDDPIVAEADGWFVRSRPPTTDDLVAIERAPTADAAAELLWQRCVVEAWEGATERTAGEVPAPVRAAVLEGWEAVDPLADVRLDVRCPACDQPSQQGFDIAAFIWSEVDTWARGLLADVHALARAYGWSEDDVLALSPLRRRCYLEMAGA